MWWVFHPRGHDVDFDEAHRVGCLPTWLIGFLIPLAFVALGSWAIVAREALIPGRWSSLTIHDSEAIALGVALIFGALTIHVRFVWTRARGLWRVADGVVLLGLLGVAGGLGYAVIRTAIHVLT